MFYDLLIFIFMSYIKPQLVDPLQIQNLGCISYYSCIKPQLRMCYHVPTLRCISYYSYIKPQPIRVVIKIFFVVYRTIPTSNHNRWTSASCSCVLYIVLFLHQTTTKSNPWVILRKLYIVLFLHQTTTVQLILIAFLRCISYYSYIKPQRTITPSSFPSVVYRTIPTSNHNYLRRIPKKTVVVYRTIPTSNHN